METFTLLEIVGRLLLACVVALLPGTIVWGTVLGIYAAYRRLAARLTVKKLTVELR